MAKSSTYHGLRRGSTKSHTYAVVDGKQITKDRVEGGKNPRTPEQMGQRCCLATVGTAYRTMKIVCDHSFEGKSAGMQCMREFNSSNLKQIQISKEYANGFFGFNCYKESAFHPGSYIISKGSLPKALVDADVESVNVAGKKVLLSLVETANGAIADVAEAMGCKNFGDMCTVAIMYPKSDGSYGFGAVRFTYVSGATVLESFTVAVIGDIASVTPTFTTNALKVEVRMAYNLATDASADNTYMAAITSRKVNGNWLRSFAQFDVTDATPTFASAISTYPVGQERFLNGSAVDVVTPSTPQEPSQTTDFALTISKSGTGTSTVKDANDQVIESGASLASGASVNIAIVPAEGKIPTATINGTSIQLTESEGTYTGSFEMPAQASTLAINSGSAGGGNDDDDLIQN